MSEKTAVTSAVGRLRRQLSDRNQSEASGELDAIHSDPLSILPVEIVLLVFDFVPPRDLITRCRLVCKRWQTLIDDPQLWQLSMARRGNFDPRLELMAVSDPNVEAPFWQKLSYFSVYEPNLIRSFDSDGKLSLKPWAQSSEDWRTFKTRLKPDSGAVIRGAHWEVQEAINPEEPRNAKLLLENKGSKENYVTTYTWCCREQFVDLQNLGFSESLLTALQPTIEVSEWFCPQHDCGCTYNLKVDILKSDYRVIDSFSFTKTFPQWSGGGWELVWEKVAHQFRSYGSGLRFIRFADAGKDTQFWAGNFGSKMAAACVRVLFSSTDKE